MQNIPKQHTWHKHCNQSISFSSFLAFLFLSVVACSNPAADGGGGAGGGAGGGSGSGGGVGNSSMKRINATVATLVMQGTSAKEYDIPSFYICDHEVTQGEWVSVWGEPTNSFSSPTPSYFDGQKGKEPADGEIQLNRPVEKINWFKAIAYCNKLSLKEGLTPCYKAKKKLYSSGPTEEIDFKNLSSPSLGMLEELVEVTCDFSANGYRLPTSLEWAYAARGGIDSTEDVWAGTTDLAQLGDYAWYKNNSEYKTHEVKKKLPNGYGLYDMSGNVCEWGWSEKTHSGSEGIWQGNHSSPAPVFGGSWENESASIKVSSIGFNYIDNNSTTNITNVNGFRVARSAPLVNITVTPIRKIYAGNESFSKDDVIVKAHYSDGSSLEIKNYNLEIKNSTTNITKFDKPGDHTIDITYSENNITKTASYNIVVKDMFKIEGGVIQIYSSDVNVSTFYICDHEVTQGEWKSIFGENNNPSFFDGKTENTKMPEGETQDNRPVENVNFYMVVVYCNKLSKQEGLMPVYTLEDRKTYEVIDWENLEFSSIPKDNTSDSWMIQTDSTANGYRVPTTNEWSYAAAGGVKSGSPIFAGTTNSSSYGKYAWYSKNTTEVTINGFKEYLTHEVKKKLPNGYGLYDMSGNVKEMCIGDDYSTYYYCGGGVDGNEVDIRSAIAEAIWNGKIYIGFRVALSSFTAK